MHSIHLTYLLTYLLCPWSKVLLEKLTGSQPVKKFPTFYGTWRFITAFTSVHHLSLSLASLIQSLSPHPSSWRYILILSCHLCPDLPSGLFASGFSTKTLCLHFSSPLYVLHALLHSRILFNNFWFNLSTHPSFMLVLVMSMWNYISNVISCWPEKGNLERLYESWNNSFLLIIKVQRKDENKKDDNSGKCFISLCWK